jgi:2-isopropylmalate synthase
MTPSEFGALIGRMKSWVPPHIVVAVHCHDDLGLSLANALAGIQAGADEVQATLGGLGERAGNTPIEELIAVLTYNGEAIGATTTAQTEGLYAAFELLCKTIGMSPPRNKAIFGENAFATQAGIHQAGILRAPITYEYMEPARFGRERSILVGRHSGRAVLRHLLEEKGQPVDEQLVQSLYTEFVAGRTNGECLNLDTLRELIVDKRSVTREAKAS